MSDRYLQWVIPGEQPDYEPVELVGTITVNEGGNVLARNLITTPLGLRAYELPPGKYLIVPAPKEEA